MTTPEFTAEEASVILSALWDYKLQNEQYLRGYGPASGHDTCCATALARDALQRERQQMLSERLRDCDAAIAKLEADR